jgi:glycosyltransferase involved in cell wall biosynthesis
MFEFLKYIQPANYYRLVNCMSHTVLVDDSRSGNGAKALYSNLETAKLDHLYQNLQSGKIPTDFEERNPLQNLSITNVKDNYVFIRRFFSPIQLIYILLIRLLSLKNPFIEFYGFINALITSKRVSIDPQEHFGWNDFESIISKKNPLVSVIIPTLNRYEYLYDVLMDLEHQEYKNFEVIVVDQSDPVNDKFYEGWNFQIQIIQQQEKALWLARNRAIQKSKGEYILLFDDDSRVNPDWINNHLKCLDFFNVQISAGVTHTLVGGGLGNKETYFHLSDVFDTGNAMVNRSVFEKVGLFDRQFEKQRMGDSEFGLRSLLKGFNIVSNPYSKRIHLKAETGGLRQLGSWDALRPKSLFSPRPIPSVLYLIRKYFGDQVAVYYVIKNIPQSYMPYRFKSSKIMRLTYLLLFPLVFPIAIIAVLNSWSIAEVKLGEGDKIQLMDITR